MTFDPSVFNKYREFMGEETDAFVADIIQTFLVSAPRALGEMDSLLKAEKRQDFVRAAHTLKSNAATVGANTLRDWCEKMELQGGTLAAPAAHDMLEQAGAAYMQVEVELKKLLG